MFLPRSAAFLLAIIAGACALPADLPTNNQTPPALGLGGFNFGEIFTRDFWSGFPFFNFFAPVNELISTSFPSVSYKDDEFRVSVNAKGYTKDNIQVKIKNGGLLMHGTKKSNSDDANSFVSQFFYSYSLPENVSSSDVKAELYSDGWLVAYAPLASDASKISKEDRTVEVVGMGKPLEKSEATTQATSTSTEDVSKNEVVTRDREEVTENSIPDDKDRYEI